jgi:non-canonical (house-cleaning) NTP pyrophosphatase
MSFATQPNPMNPAAQGRPARAQPAHFHQELVTKLNEYKTGLLEELSNEPETFLHFAWLAVNEAESLAWSTPYAHFFLPALVEEKIQCARQWANRQSRVGNGLPAVTTSHEVIRRNEPLEIPQDTLATGCESRLLRGGVSCIRGRLQ